MEFSYRKVVENIKPQMVIEGAGVLLRRSFAPSRANLHDPFLLFDHFAFNDPADAPAVGFPTHPHRGIETVTYMLEGNVRHRDSLGNTGVISAGDVQWMTSGSGILHEEIPQPSPSGVVNGFQLWVNLPAAEKMGQPRYQEVKQTEIPTYQGEGVAIRVVAGDYQGTSGPVTEIAAQPLYLDVTLEAETEFELPLPADHNLLVYVFDGEGLFGVDPAGQGEIVNEVRMLVLGEGSHFKVKSSPQQGVRFVLFAGSAFGEPIVPYGPFVMNTEAEIQQAFVDLRSGSFVQHENMID
ncbi:MAG: pirin family protein [Chloroflexota bacterium]